MQDRNSKIEAEQFVPGPLKTTATWFDDTPTLICEFISLNYSREHYEALAKRAGSLIEKALENLRDSNEEEVQAKVTCRAKTEKSLEEKLKLRNQKRKLEGKKEYETFEDILEDVKDLAGVRVVLYTPNEAQRNKVREVIKSIWGPDVEEKHHNGATSSAANDASPNRVRDHSQRGDNVYVRKHFGYQAEHYRTPMKKEQGTDTYGWKRHDKVEIQVVSALGHAWAEAGHDVLYKTHAYGPPSVQEERILDALSGLISSGDLFLEQFRELVTKRTYAKWQHPEHFTIFLRESDVLERREDQGGSKSHIGYQHDFTSDSVDILFRFLVKTANNYPLAVRNALRDLGYPQDPETGLNEELKRFEPPLNPPRGLLTPLCIISRLLPKKQAAEEHDDSEKCSVMMDALILLQTFAGSPGNAKTFLRDPRIKMANDGKDSLNFVLSSPSRQDCLPGFGRFYDAWIEDLQPAWKWFQQQATDDRSLCGLFFRLAGMGVPAKVLDDRERLKELKINSLSRSNTLEDHDD